MATVAHQPWKPTCWVGGNLVQILRHDLKWADDYAVDLHYLSDDSREKYAATKATAAILRSMRK